jgi:hypothetical protein
MNRTTSSLLPFASLALALGVAGCANRSHEGAAPDAIVPEASASSDAAHADADARASSRPAVALERRAHDVRMTEVVPDAAGVSALTLDEHGGVRLWPDLHAEDALVPIELPVHEPTWMSLSRGEAGFVAAFVDTAGAARVARIEPTEGGARWIPLFHTPPTDPLLEVHVLRGGTRILALGVDHRVRLFDRSGAVRAEIDRAGFVPWQLRVAEPEGGDPVVLAVLSGPVRVQRIALGKDSLDVVGEPLNVALDRGPNRNDLELTPDGGTVLALMRRKAKTARFELEAIDLATGARTIVAAESDMKIRPRVLALGGSRVLLETGSGKGLRLDASAGSVWPPVDGVPDRDALPLTTLAPAELSESSEDARMHAVVRGRVRLLPTAAGLVVDPLKDGEPTRVLGTEPFSPTAVALDRTGDRVAWATARALVIETLAGEPTPHRATVSSEPTKLLAFVGADALVLMDAKGRVRLQRLGDGTEIASAEVPVSWGIAASGFRPAKDGAAGGEIVLSSLDPGEPVRVLSVTESGLGELRSVPKAERSAWPEAGKPNRAGSAEFLAAQGLQLAPLDLRPAKVLLAEPDPAGARTALAQKILEAEGTFDATTETWIEGDKTFVVTMVDREANTRTWTLPSVALADLAWSADGRRVAIADRNGGLVLDAATGDTLHARRRIPGVTTRS